MLYVTWCKNTIMINWFPSHTTGRKIRAWLRNNPQCNKVCVGEKFYTNPTMGNHECFNVNKSKPDHTNCSESDHWRRLVIASFPFIHQSDECCRTPLHVWVFCVWKRACRLATGFFVMGLNQIVVRNSLGSLRMAERWEVVEGRESFTWWHKETDLSQSPRWCSHLCVWILPSLFTHSRNTLRVLETWQNG